MIKKNIYFNDEDCRCRFRGHHIISLSDLKEIAKILNVDDLLYESETEQCDGDHETIIDWSK